MTLPVRYSGFRPSGLLALAIALGTISGAGTGSAAQIGKLRLGNWNGGAFTNDKTGAFSHCAASANYKSGVTLLFSITSDKSWSMGFSSPTWDLTPGSTYPVKFWVDDGRVLDGTAIAKTGKLAQVFLPANSTLFGAFRYGQMLRVAAEKQTLAFRLTDTSDMLTMLLRCANEYQNRRGGSNPFGDSRPANPGPSNPFGDGTPPRTPARQGQSI